MFNIFSRVAELEQEVLILTREVNILKAQINFQIRKPKPYEKVMAKAEEIKKRGRKRKDKGTK